MQKSHCIVNTIFLVKTSLTYSLTRKTMNVGPGRSMMFAFLRFILLYIVVVFPYSYYLSREKKERAIVYLELCVCVCLCEFGAIYDYLRSIKRHWSWEKVTTSHQHYCWFALFAKLGNEIGYIGWGRQWEGWRWLTEWQLQ